ncbi:hypothetical protein HN419_07195 [Candidatus Woesearchaeota archaeon]|nr:hypothetical protein [Candidatus Woesearchaeota archaeon]MBT3538278.1 hypothetical protein [Candidatus Woesearchaeota archaeon]MBT4697567.1 hypothetical protein [Candidatus Woesearchaeota archaeon]MBT4717444.1 hypothetical protein [Candidatus Woesearchaeota archaeon]MBT7105947.1 hypothetical protein [Candidatus Woesearchaeota archaeon]
MIDVAKVKSVVEYLLNIIRAQSLIIAKTVDSEKKLEGLRKKIAKHEGKLIHTREKAVNELLREEAAEQRDKTRVGELIRVEFGRELKDEGRVLNTERAEEHVEEKLITDTKEEIDCDLHIKKDLDMQESLLRTMLQMVARPEFNADASVLTKFANSCDEYGKLLHDKISHFSKKKHVDIEVAGLIKKEKALHSEELKEETEVRRETDSFANAMGDGVKR